MSSKLFKSFRPSISFTILLSVLTLLFIMLGTWQTKRAAEKQATQQQHQLATSLSLEKAMAGDNRFSQIEVVGHYDANRHFLLDNQIWNGRAGVHVFTPFYSVTGYTILVNRGWLPLAPDRKTMPDITTPQDDFVLRGVLNTLPVPGRILGSADKLDQDKWPQLVTYLNLEDLSESLEQPLENWVIQLSESEQSGFEGRQWKAVFLNADRHKAYAFTWFALAAVSIMMWVYSSFRNPPGNRT
jgi:surfeit locus 1 family protein